MLLLLAPVTTRILAFLIGDPNLNLYLPLESWEGFHIPTSLPNYIHAGKSPKIALFESRCIFQAIIFGIYVGPLLLLEKNPAPPRMYKNLVDNEINYLLIIS